jgi:16S rRNA (cytidine1402-2'-O)-methyltransferase
MSGRLAVVGTPIGNLEDVTPRAVRTLREASTIYCEDTRRTRRLLSALGVPAPRLVRLDRHTEAELVGPAVELVAAGGCAVLVSDAGMPTVSDPGALLVKGVAGAGLPTEVVPGPCAVSAALAVSGLPASQYRFTGFLPRKGRERKEALAALAAEPATVVIYEAPARVPATVADLAGACGGERELVAARELTKVHEEVWRGTLGTAGDWLAAKGEPRGEWVLLLGPRPEAEGEEPGGEEIASALRRRIDAGADRKQAVAEVAAALGVPRRQVYDVAVDLKSAG